jgi:hypothetical protein
MNVNRSVLQKKELQQAASLLQVIRAVYCLTTAEYLLLTTNSAGIASAISRAIPNGNCGTPFGGGGNAPAVSVVLAVQSAEPSWLLAAFTLSVVVLPGVLGAVTLTVMIWLIESDAVDGTGLGGVMLTIVQVPDGDPGVTLALKSKVDLYADESL